MNDLNIISCRILPNKYGSSRPRPWAKSDSNWDGHDFWWVIWSRSLPKNNESSHLRPWAKSDYNWDGLDFLWVILCQSLPQNMSHPFSDHEQSLILTETVLNFYEWSWVKVCQNKWEILSQTMDLLRCHQYVPIRADTCFTWALMARRPRWAIQYENSSYS
jgi:hypothetical protein